MDNFFIPQSFGKLLTFPTELFCKKKNLTLIQLTAKLCPDFKKPQDGMTY